MIARLAVTSNSVRSRVVSCLCGARDGMPMWTRFFARLRHRGLSRCHGILRSAPPPGAIAMPWDSSLGSATGGCRDAMGFFARLRLAQNDKGEAVILRSAAGVQACPKRSEGKDLPRLAITPARRKCDDDLPGLRQPAKPVGP